jgi:hypothetical protein
MLAELIKLHVLNKTKMFTNPKTVSEYNSLSRKVALITFLLGSLIVALYYFTSFSGVIYISLFYMISFFIINTTLFTILVSLFFKNKKDRKSIFLSLFSMFLNIPIGYLYLQMGFKIYGLLTN